jgi:hypothetical protein
MNNQERQVIEELFERLADIERRGRPPGPEAEAFIRQRIAAQLGAPYYMAQTIVAQEEALNAAQDRINELENRPARGPAGVGSFLSSLFGDGGQRRPQAFQPQPQPMAYPQGRYAQGGHGFLAGAAQTAMGVAGGVLLGNMIADAFSPNHAAAADDVRHSAAADDAQSAADDYGSEPGDVGEDVDFGTDI